MFLCSHGYNVNKKKSLLSYYVHIASSPSTLINFVVRSPQYVLWNWKTSTDIVHVNTLECKYTIRHFTSISFFLFFLAFQWQRTVILYTHLYHHETLAWAILPGVIVKVEKETQGFLYAFIFYFREIVCITYLHSYFRSLSWFPHCSLRYVLTDNWWFF